MYHGEIPTQINLRTLIEFFIEHRASPYHKELNNLL
jgi:hypothetical protein